MAKPTLHKYITLGFSPKATTDGVDVVYDRTENNVADSTDSVYIN